MSNRATLKEIADDQYGYVTTEDAKAAGVPPVELRKLATRGALQHVRRGVYRLADPHRTELDQLAEAVVRTGPDAYLTHDAVLALHRLALVNPDKIRVATPHRVRRADTGFVEIVRRALPDEEVTTYEGIPSTTVARALTDCRGMVMNERLLVALDEARREGLVTTKEAKRVRRELRQVVKR